MTKPAHPRVPKSTETARMRPVSAGVSGSPSKKPPSRLRRWLKRLFGLALLGGVLLAGVAGGSFFYFSRDLPSVQDLKTWRPPQVTKVVCRDGQVCAEFYRERRTWVDVAKLPAHVRFAFLAAEDADFYKHEGLDYLGMLRSGLKNLRPGSAKTGASTISQQACRNILLSQERTLARKIREWILTPRMEAALTKDEILNLYVNTIYFGHRRYGLEEASLFYFGKSAKDLSLGEAAVIAGTVQSPIRKNPLANVVKAKKRQRYVLEQMANKGFEKRAAVDAAKEAPIVLGPRPRSQVGGYYIEEVRKALVARYGEQAVLEGGMRVRIGMDPTLQGYAETSVRAGLEAVDQRRGYRGPVGEVDLARFEALRPLIARKLAEAGRRKAEDILVADLKVLKDMKPEEEELPQHEVEEVVDLDEPIPDPDEVLVRSITVRTLAEDLDVVGVVTRVDDKAGHAVVDLVGKQARLDFKSAAWARRFDGKKTGPAPKTISAVVSPGDLVRVRLGRAVPASQLVEATLAQVPEVQGALVALDPKDRTVVAMVGGYDFERSAFNRATQARRQPGSSFKPFLYAAALETTKYTPISVVNDAPEAIRDPWTGKMWKPKNYENGFDGPLTLRQALTRSKNTVSVRLIEALGPEAVIDFARKAGIRSELPQNLTLALGTGEVSVLEIANAYTTLQTQGQYADAVTIVSVADGAGKVLEEHHAAAEQVLPASVAFLATSLMRSVVEEGTATAVLQLQRPAAGKTGTAQEYRDAWFSGFTTDLVATAWVGYDDHSVIGHNETGGRAALPLWLRFMAPAHEGRPRGEFPVPEGVVQLRIDPVSGKLAGTAVPGREESFLAGTEPVQSAPPPGTVDPNDFMLHDRGSR